MRRPTGRELRGCLGSLAFCAAALPAAAEPFGWPQPNGPGTPVYLTYSYGNLFEPGFNTTLSAGDLRTATEAAFGIWARYAPIHLFEVPDPGPAPSETEYSATTTSDIRIGYQPALPEGGVAHAHVPLARERYTASGLGGDIHFSNDLSEYGAAHWGQDGRDALALDFFSTMLHEAGHALGLLHLMASPSIMGSVLHVFPGFCGADLFPADIAAIRGLYGAGRGSVNPLGDGPPIPHPEPASLLLLAAGTGVLLFRNRSSATM